VAKSVDYPHSSITCAVMLLLEDNIGGPLKMPTKLKDTLEKIRKLDNKSNSDLLIEFYEYLRAVRNSENVDNIVNPRGVKTI